MSIAESVAERSTTAEVRPPGKPRAATEPKILRIDASSVPNLLARFGAPSALAAGQVDVIDLEALPKRLGIRWRARRDVAHLHAEHILAQRLGPAAAVLRLDDTRFVVAQPDLSRIEAQALCFRCLREILQHFISEALPGELKLYEATLVTTAEIHARRIDLDDDLAAEIELSDMGAAGPPLGQTTRFIAANGRTVRVSCVLEPVVNLASSSRIGFRLARRVIDVGADRALSAQELQNLSRADIARVDYATISRGLDRLHAETGEEKLPTLIVPVSSATISNERTREGLVALLEQARTEVRHGLVCEIRDIEGMGHEILAQNIALIRPFAFRLIAHVAEPTAAAFTPLRGLGLDGVSVECPPNLGDAEFVGWTRQTARSAKAAAGALFLYRVQSLQRGALASLAGASHVSIAASPRT
jgi:hypothetical protein